MRRPPATEHCSSATTCPGILPAVSDSTVNHGPGNDQGLEVPHQGDKLFVRVFQKEQPVRAVPVGPADSFPLAALCLRQLRKGTPWLTDQGVLAALKCTVQRMAHSPAGTRRVA
jgi:hypothetical protein